MKIHSLVLIAATCALAAPPQQFKLNLDSIASKASNAVDLSLTGPTLKFAAKFLDASDPDEAGIKKLIDGLDGIYVKHFEFKRKNMWTQADLEPIRNQLRGPDWQRIVGVSSEDGETGEIYLRVQDGKNTGVAILEAEEDEVTVINIVGTINLDQLAELGGHFDIPKLKMPKDKTGK
ncbi:MAG TPA: DUF4252 domain-containing protein [Bryobacteraceae bacterium]|jgi:hypothetical protein|nr:DUF4252 domain-containing protein [Bryobacteraceae bacterium]